MLKPFVTLFFFSVHLVLFLLLKYVALHMLPVKLLLLDSVSTVNFLPQSSSNYAHISLLETIGNFYFKQETALLNYRRPNTEVCSTTSNAKNSLSIHNRPK